MYFLFYGTGEYVFHHCFFFQILPLQDMDDHYHLQLFMLYFLLLCPIGFVFHLVLLYSKEKNYLMFPSLPVFSIFFERQIFWIFFLRFVLYQLQRSLSDFKYVSLFRQFVQIFSQNSSLEILSCLSLLNLYRKFFNIHRYIGNLKQNLTIL